MHKKLDIENIRTKKKNILGGKVMEEKIPDEPIHLSDGDFDENVKKYQTIAVDCWAPWCGPCRMVEPVVADLAKEMKGKIVFGKLNVDENQMVSMKYGIMSIPTLLVFKNGTLVDRIIGAMPKEMLKARLAPYE